MTYRQGLTIFKNISWLMASFFLFYSCSLKTLQKKKEKAPKIEFGEFSKYVENDYIDQLVAYEKFYLNSPDIKTVNFLNSERDFLLKKILGKIIRKNELFFKKKIKPNVYIINHKKAFHFSLPNRTIFLSLGLVKKYIKNESILASVLCYEIVRSEKNIYNKNIIVPTGFITTKRMLNLMRINLNAKKNLHKWSYYFLKRAGFDANSYLSWIQIKNRNSSDFTVQLGDLSSFSREEALFKSFLIKNNKKTIYEESNAKSSKNFYRLINRLTRIKYET
jgi:hypothetical protein